MNSNTAEALVDDIDESIEDDAAEPPKGLVTEAIERLIATVFEPALKDAEANVERTKEEHAKAVEYAASNPSKANQEALGRAHIAAMTAPAIKVRAESVLREARRHLENDDVHEADRLLVDGLGAKTTFTRALEGPLMADVQKNATALAESIKALYEAHVEHGRANAESKRLVKTIHRKLEQLNEKANLTHALGTRVLDTVPVDSLVYAVARTVKRALVKTIGLDRERRFEDGLSVTTVSRAGQ